MSYSQLRLKKGEDRRIRTGHPWIYSNEIDTRVTKLQSFIPGQEVIVTAHNQEVLGSAYVNPLSLIAARIFSRETEFLDLEFFLKKIRQAEELRKHQFAEPFYRLVFSEADELPGIVIDRFGNDFVLQINTAGMELKQKLIADALIQIFPETQSILLRNDNAIRIQEGLELYSRTIYGNPKDEIIIKENGSQFYVPLLKGQKTGWFYDHRLNRARVQNYVKDQTLLDVFSYLGGFGIESAQLAKQVDCIEASAFAADFIRRNAELNKVGNKVNVIVEDAFDAMKKLIQSGKHYDVIVLDPPAFIKKLKDRKEGLLAYQRINELAIKLLATNGTLVSCSCSMHLKMDDLLQSIQRAAVRTRSRLQILERGHQGLDHPLHLCIPEMDYLKAIFLRKY